MNPDELEWLSLSESERISIAGRCPRRHCRNANRIDAKYCREHRFSKNLKCTKMICPKYRTALSKYCREHTNTSKTTTINKIPLKCERCGNSRTTGRYHMCSSCIRNILKCRFCKINPAVKWRGYVCTSCPLPYKLKCKTDGCQKRMLSKKLGVCSYHK
jgi:hypothetical protein